MGVGVRSFSLQSCHKLKYVQLAQGIIFTPSMSCLAHHFNRYRAIAFGIYAGGASVGGAIFPIFLQKLFQRIGFVWTVRCCRSLTSSLRYKKTHFLGSCRDRSVLPNSGLHVLFDNSTSPEGWAPGGSPCLYVHHTRFGPCGISQCSSPKHPLFTSCIGIIPFCSWSFRSNELRGNIRHRLWHDSGSGVLLVSKAAFH